MIYVIRIQNICFPLLHFAAIVEEPEFTEHIENITVPAGRNIKLGCSVKNLGSFKVSRLAL